MWFGRLLFLLSVFVCLASAQYETYVYHECSGANYTSNSTYQENLNTLLSSMSFNDMADGYYNFSVGDGPDIVNSIALCRGDIDQTACQGCVNFSTADLPQRCPTKIEAIVWYDDCMLRYSNRSIFQSQEEPFLYLRNAHKVSDTNLFRQQLYNLLPKLVEHASSGDSARKFAVGDISYANFTRIYGLVQCTPDLTEFQCSSCLGRSITQSENVFPGSQGGRALGPSCNFRYETYQFYFGSSTIAPPSPTATTIVPPTGGGSYKVRDIIISVVSTACFLILTISVLTVLKLRKRKAKGQDNFLLADAHDITSTESLQFDFETIRFATDNFKEENKLGQGGFGSVYKGKLVEGKEIAVKRLAANSGQGDIEFKNEVVIVARLQHRNLVRLLGFCLDGNERLLIYEFVPNSSLDRFLFDPLKRACLDWETRYKIIGGVARGLLYLHEDSRLRIIHRDLKAGNILLDGEMCPKIADFGMARLFIPNQTQGDTNRIVGTYGYMAPEYAMHGKFSVKSDVYSFGILLLEIISGQKYSRFSIRDTPFELTSFAWESWKAGTATDLIDSKIFDGPSCDILRIIHIGLLCVQDSVSARPTMASVINMLNSASLSLPLPSKPAYLATIESEGTTSGGSAGEVGTMSINQISITDQLPR